MIGVPRSRLLVLSAMVLLAGCSDPAGEPPAQFIAVRRAWQPGERAALINHIVTNRDYAFLYVGDISDLAPQLYADSESVSVMVPNPAYTGSPSVTGPIVAPAPGAEMGAQFSVSWNFVATKITSINNSQTPPDTVFWHMTMWSDPANAGNHGFIIGFSRPGIFNLSQINTTTFDANAGKLGAGGGEFHQSTGTLWSDVSSGGNYQSTSEVFPGAFASITTGPYLGGQSRAGTAYGRIFNSTFTRVSGTELPASFPVAFDYRAAGLPAVEILCVFPSPCTTNVPAMMAAFRASRRASPPAR